MGGDYLPLVPATGAAPITDDPAQILLPIRDYPTFKTSKSNSICSGTSCVRWPPSRNFAPVVDWLRIIPGTHDKIARASLALMAGTMDFCAVHAVTGTHWIRIIGSHWPNQDEALRYFWAAIASLYPKIGFPDLPSAKQLDDWRHAPCPDWPDISPRRSSRMTNTISAMSSRPMVP